MDDQEPSQEAILTAVAEYHQVSLSELSNRLETDFGRLFREVEALLEAGELVRANRFTYRLAEETPTDEPGPAEAVEHTPEGAGPDRPEAESSPATDEARRTAAVDDARASAPSTRQRAAAGRLALLGVVAIALGALGLYPVLVGERNGVLTAGAVTALVDDRSPELVAGGAAGLVVLGGLSVLGGWVIAVGRSGQLARPSDPASAGEDPPPSEGLIVPCDCLSDMTSAIKRLDATAEVPEAAFEVEIIDMDFHVNPMEEALQQYVESDVALDRLTTEFGMTPIPDKWDAAFAIEEGNEGLFTQGRAEYPEDVRAACEPLAIDEPVVNAGINGLPHQHHPVLKNAVVQAGNDYMLDHFVDEGFMTSLSIPKWDPDYALEELDRWGREDGVVAVYSWYDCREPWGSQKFDPVFEKLVDLGLPLMLHGSLAFWPQHSYIGDSMLTWTEVLGFDWPFHGMINAVNLIMTGVFDRFPELDVVFQEAGHWWLPFVRYRMDEFYEMHPEDVKITPRKFEDGDRYLDKSPSDYLRDNIYVCTQPFALPRNAGDARDMLRLSLAAETFCYSSDWPHQTLDPPTWFFTSRAFRDDEDLTNAILHENAREILRL